MRRSLLCATIVVFLFSGRSAGAQSESFLETTGPKSVAAAYKFSFAGFQGRSLSVNDATLAGRLSPRLTLWLGHQNVVARGRFAGDRFTCDADRFGARYLFGASEYRGLALQYEGYRAGHGLMVGPNSSSAPPEEVTRVQFPGTQTDMLAAQVAFGKRLSNQTASPLPTYLLSLSYSHVQAVGRSANGVGLGAGLLFPISRHVTGEFRWTEYLEGAQGLVNTSAVTHKSHLFAVAAFQPVQWARLLARADFLPFGLPVGGTSLSGNSGFLLYQPGGATSGLERRALGVFSLELQIGTRF